jgi:hypothetical protein
VGVPQAAAIAEVLPKIFKATSKGGYGYIDYFL